MTSSEPVRDEAPQRKRRISLGRASVFGLVPRATTVLVALGLSPYIVSEIGLAAFGLWSLIQAVLLYVGIAGDGFPAVATRIVARAEAANDRAQLRTAAWLATGASAMVASAVLALGVVLAHVVSPTTAGSSPEDWPPTVVAAAGSLGLLLLANGAASVTRGLGRWDIDASISTISQVVSAVATVAFLEAGYGLPGVALGAVAMNGVMAFAYLVAAVSLGALRRPSRTRAPAVGRELWQDGVALQVSAFVGATNAQADRFMLLPFASLSWIGAYALGTRAAVAFRSFPLVIFGPFMVRVADEHGRNGLHGVRNIYRDLQGQMVVYLVPVLVVAYAVMFPAVLAWLGTDYVVSAAAAVVLGLGYAFNVATGPGTSAAIACGRPDLVRNYTVIGLVLNLSFSVALGAMFGGWGVAAATTIGLVGSSCWLIQSAERWLDVEVSSPLLRTFEFRRAAIAATASGAVAIAVPTLVDLGRLANLTLAIIVMAAGTAAVLYPLRFRLQWFGRAVADS